jgi:hypothetical protein
MYHRVRHFADDGRLRDRYATHGEPRLLRSIVNAQHAAMDRLKSVRRIHTHIGTVTVLNFEQSVIQVTTHN